MTVVLDASVILKWLLANPEKEPDTERAVTLVRAVISGELQAAQPCHWLAEVGAVLSRISPETAIEDVLMLRAMELPISDEADVWRRACALAIDTRQHVFDTLYHAVALQTDDAVLITADDRYRAKAQSHGRLLRLRDWTPGV